METIAIIRLVLAGLQALPYLIKLLQQMGDQEMGKELSDQLTKITDDLLNVLKEV